MTLKSDPNFEGKLTFSVKNDIWNLVNFNASSGKSEKELCREKFFTVSKMT